MNGAYFKDAEYSFTHSAKDAYVVTALSASETDSGGAAASVIMSVSGGDVTWTGTLLD